MNESNDLLDKTNLLTNSDTTTDILEKANEIKSELTTQVTSIAQEEQKTGQQVKVPSIEELVANASSSYFNSMVHFEQVFTKLSARAKTRVAVAVLQLPEEKVPVKMKTDEERLAFGLGQRALANRFLLTQYYINRQVEEQRNKTNNTEEVKTNE